MGVFHISFKDRLQELIIAKTKKKIGPEYEDDEDEAGEQAITAPDGLEGTGKQLNDIGLFILTLGCSLKCQPSRPPKLRGGGGFPEG